MKTQLLSKKTQIIEEKRGDKMDIQIYLCLTHRCRQTSVPSSTSTSDTKRHADRDLEEGGVLFGSRAKRVVAATNICCFLGFW
jgi:hypothetical protein